jgi:X-X-X-Leu-X-X-Gly heptad repeat protein
MDATVWQIISIVGYSLAGLLFLVSIILFIKLNILAIIGDLTGRTAAKQIQAIREENSRTGNKRFGPSSFNAERGELTEPITKSKKLRKSGSTWGITRRSNTKEDTETIPLGTQVLADGTQVLADGTQVLANGTEVLTDGTQVLAEGTQVLNDRTLVEESGTTVLNITQDLTNEEHPHEQVMNFKVVKDVKITHTNETL